MEDNKKHLHGKGENYPLIGNFIHYHILENKIKKVDVARALGILPTSLNDYFKKESLQFAVLWKLSQAMQYNFIAQLSEYLPIPFETQKEKALLKELAQKNELIREMEIKLAVYEKITGQR